MPFQLCPITSATKNSCRWFRRLDQACIYLLIVATYSPFSVQVPTAVCIGGTPCSAGCGCSRIALDLFQKCVFAHRVESVSIWLYLLSGLDHRCVSGMPFVGLVPAEAQSWMIIARRRILFRVVPGFFFNDTKGLVLPRHCLAPCCNCREPDPLSWPYTGTFRFVPGGDSRCRTY